VAVENGLAAVEAAAANSFDIGILDLQMPVMGGREAAAAIKANGSSGTGRPAGLPVISLTADAVPETGGDGWTAEFDRWLTKPIDWAELNEAIEQTIRGAEKGLPATAS
jgi:CheY-like chemotaxis protein